MVAAEVSERQDGWVIYRLLIGASLLLLTGGFVYLLSPRYWRESADDDTPGLLRAIFAVVAVRDGILYLFLVAIAVAYVVMGNRGGRLIGISLLVLLLVVAYRFVRKRRARDPRGR